MLMDSENVKVTAREHLGHRNTWIIHKVERNMKPYHVTKVSEFQKTRGLLYNINAHTHTHNSDFFFKHRKTPVKQRK